MSLLDQLTATREIYAQAEGLDLGPFDELTNSYGTVEQGFQIRLAEKDEKIQELTAEISKLKSLNFDLMMAAAPAPTDGDGDGEIDSDGDGEEDDNPDASHGGIDSLFSEDN